MVQCLKCFVYTLWTVYSSVGCRWVEYRTLSCFLSVSSEVYNLTHFLIHNVSFKRAYRVHGPQLLDACPRGGRFSCFSLMEKALGMKFPLTAESFKPSKRSALLFGVNRWGWRAEDRIQMRVRCIEDEKHIIRQRQTLSLTGIWKI